MRILPPIVGLLVGLLTPASVARAQTFTEDISIVEVEVPVQVLVDGRAVRGLTRDNFELLVDGEPKQLSWFEAVELDERPTDPAPTSRPTTADSNPARAAPGRQRHYLMLFDLGFASRHRVRDAVRGMRRMVETQSHPSDRLALAVFAEAIGARVLVPFTTDRRGTELGFQFVEALVDARSRRAIERLESLDAWWRSTPERGALPEPLLVELGTAAGTLIQPLGSRADPAGVGLPIRRPDEAGSGSSAYRKRRLDSLLTQRSGALGAVRALGRSMASLVTLLRDVPEPKHVLYLSEGLGAMFNDTETATPVLHRLKPMVDAFGDTGWTLQALDIGGIPAPPTSALAGPEDFDSSVELGLGTVVTAGSDNSSLFYLANETGGELFENYNRIHRATEKILDRTRATYLLGFQPSDLAPDGRRYDIEVRLTPKIPGARVVHRPSFRAPRPPIDRLMAQRRMDAADLVLSGERLDELEARVRPVVLPARLGDRVPVFVEVEASALDAGKKDRKRVRLDVHGFALDSTGRVRAGFARELRFRLDGERVIGLADEIALAPGRHELRLLVWDLRGGGRHLSHTPIEVRPPEPGASLSGPFFVASTEHRRQFGRREPEATAGTLPLFRIGAEPAAIDLSPAIERGRSRRFVLLAFDEAAGEPERHVRVRVRPASGLEPSSFELEPAVERLDGGSEGTARFGGLLETATLVPGSYRLEALLETEAYTLAVSSTGFVVLERPEPQSR